MSYTVRLAEFEGPFDLLFHLIEKSQVDIYDIPISQITEQYLEYIEDLSNFSLEIASEFLLMASTLIEIKSKMLLPEKGEEQISMDIEDEDPRQDLVKRLLEYKKYKEIAEDLKNREKIFKKIYFKGQEQLDTYIDKTYDDIKDLEPVLLLESFHKVIIKKQNAKKNKPLVNEIERDVINIESKILQLKNYLLLNDYLTFNQLFKDIHRKSELIVTFIALLELIKSKYATVKQEKIFGEIIISKKK